MSSNPEISSPNNSNRDSQLLSPIEAAHFLGVTPELLFAYARYAPKKNLGHERTLPYVTNQRHEGFRPSDLESFNAYLHEPWSESNTDRPAIPTYIVDYLKVECGGQCARCGKGYKLENAHINPYADTRSHHHHNLIRLCSECHEKYDAQPTSLISREEIQALKDQLVAKVRERLYQSIRTGYSRTGRMPNPTSQFVGREHEIGILVEALQSSRSVSIQGPGGIGKTQLLLNALQRISDERPILWINVEAYSSVPDLELALATSLSQEGAPVPAHAMIDFLADAEVKVIFDGVEQFSPSEMDDLEDFFGNLLTMTSTPQFIFTSQAELNELDIDVRLQVETLDETAGMLILRSALDPKQLEALDAERQLRWLEAFCEGHPLSLRLTARLLHYFKSVSVVVDRIVRNGALVLQNPTRKRQTTGTSLRACLLVSYQTLTVNQHKILWLSSQCPAGLWIEMLDKLSDYGIDDLDGDIAALRRWHLLDVRLDALERPRLYLLSPIRAFVESEWKNESPTDAQELCYSFVHDLTIQAMVLNFKHVQKGNAEYGLFRFDQEFPNYMQILRISINRASADERYFEFIGALSSSLMVYCFVRGLFESGARIMRFGVTASLKLGRKIAASSLLLQILSLAQRIHNFQLVQNVATELALLAEGSDELQLLANAEMAKGDVAMHKQKLDEALNHFATAALYYEREIKIKATRSSVLNENNLEAQILSKDGFTVEHLLALALKQQGFVHETIGRATEALPFYLKALDIVREVNDEINLGSILHGIGNCAADTGQFSLGVESYTAAAEQFCSLGVAEFLSNSLSELGYLLIGYDPSVSIDLLISKEILANGLLDVQRQIISNFSSSEIPPTLGVGILRKTLGMIILASFSSHNHLLENWAKSLQELILRPLIIEVQYGRRSQQDGFPLMCLDCIITVLAIPLATIEQPSGIGATPVLEEIAYFARSCYRYFERYFGLDWMAHYSFKWLATYLRRHRGLQNISSVELNAAAKASEEMGLPFSISGL